MWRGVLTFEAPAAKVTNPRPYRLHVLSRRMVPKFAANVAGSRFLVLVPRIKDLNNETRDNLSRHRVPSRIAGDRAVSSERDWNEIECGDEEHEPPGEANWIGRCSHHQTEARAQGREGSEGNQREQQLGAGRLLLGR